MESTEYYPNLEVGHLFSRSWEVFKANIGLVFGVLIVQFLILIILAAIPVIGWLLSLLIVGPLQAGAYFVFVRMVRDEDVVVRDMFDGFKEFGRTLGVYWLYSIVIMIGTLLLVVPGIILAVGLMPAMYLVLDANYGIVDTLKESWDMTKGYKWSLFVLFLAIFGIVILGTLVFLVGAIFAIAFAYVVVATAYDELSQTRPV